MKIGIACGGTGGHVFPGLATAHVLRQRGHEVFLLLAGKDVERLALEDWDGPVLTVPAQGFSSGFSPKNIFVLCRLFMAVVGCRRIMRDYQPDVLLAMGSYASVGPVLAARQRKIPVVLHESNVIPGRATRLLSRWASALAIGFDESRRYLRHPRLVFTGTPFRKGFPDVRRETWQGLQSNVFTVLVMGGSRGAHVLNKCACAAIIRVHTSGRKIQVIHLTGLADEAETRQAYQDSGVPNLVFGFLLNMAAAYQRADLAIFRSGASTCAELSYYNMPALLVPYPYATNQHQLANAQSLVRAGSADLITEDKLTVDWLTDYLSRQMDDPARLNAMRASAKKMVSADPTPALADLIEAVGKSR